MNGVAHLQPYQSEFVEVDPTGRYGRYNEILGKGASKTVYRAFDEYKGIEVAWNQVKLYDFLQSSEDLERLYCEIHLLKTLKHMNIMTFYTSWVDTANRNINFVTEMFTSGTLRQYRLKHRRVNIRAVKNWCRQILEGLHYLHSHDPPVIHRDLKCDNIFINGNQGEVKIGDLGLAAILRKSHAAHCVGTPEFMAPEVYEEAYNELVDIYSFGMCMLEMVTFEYPYSECTHPAQIYKKVISGKKPDALYKVKDPEVRQFVGKCLATVSLRLSARELLNDPFLQVDYCESNLRQVECRRELNDIGPFLRQPSNDYLHSNGYANGFGYESQREWGDHSGEIKSTGIELFEYHEDEHTADVDISIKGKRKEDDSIFLRLRISDKEGRIRNIYFPFDIDGDTALSVATEMVGELDITDQDVTKIADMIDGEITLLVPEWKPGPGIDETSRFANQRFCDNCASNRPSNGSLMEFFTNNSGLQLQCCRQGCASMHGRFGEIIYQAEESEHHITEDAPNVSSQSDCLHYLEIGSELNSVGSGQIHSDVDYDKSDEAILAKDVKEMKLENESNLRKSIQLPTGSSPFCTIPSWYFEVSDVYENEIQQEFRWLKAKCQMQLREVKDQQLGITIHSSQYSTQELNAHTNKGHINLETYSAGDCEGMKVSDFARHMVTANNSSLLHFHSLHRSTSLPVDAVHI